MMRHIWIFFTIIILLLCAILFVNAPILALVTFVGLIFLPAIAPVVQYYLFRSKPKYYDDPGDDPNENQKTRRRFGKIGEWAGAITYHIIEVAHKGFPLGGLIRWFHRLLDKHDFPVPRRNADAPYHPRDVGYYVLSCFILELLWLWGIDLNVTRAPFAFYALILLAVFRTYELLGNTVRAMIVSRVTSNLRSLFYAVIGYIEVIVLFAVVRKGYVGLNGVQEKTWDAIKDSISAMLGLSWGELQLPWQITAVQAIISVLFMAVVISWFVALIRETEKDNPNTVVIVESYQAQDAEGRNVRISGIVERPTRLK